MVTYCGGGCKVGGVNLLSPHSVYWDVEDTDVCLTLQMTHIITVLADRSHATELCLHPLMLFTFQ